MLVDGDEARIYLNPSRTVLDAFEQRMSQQEALCAQSMKNRDLPAQTVDGVRLPLHANIGLDADIDLARNSEAAMEIGIPIIK